MEHPESSEKILRHPLGKIIALAEQAVVLATGRKIQKGTKNS